MSVFRAEADATGASQSLAMYPHLRFASSQCGSSSSSGTGAYGGFMALMGGCLLAYHAVKSKNLQQLRVAIGISTSFSLMVAYVQVR